MTRLADDRRARVPFALVGVLLLVGASTYAAAVATEGPSRVDHSAGAAMERASAATTAALRSAVGDAARAAAAEPVTAPAETAYGRLLDEDTPFRDALRLRIYRRLRAELPATRYRRDDVTAVGSVPAATTPTELERAMDRVSVAGVENGTALRVTVRGLTVTVREDDRILARENRTQMVTVSTPVLALHERATAFETRLNRGPLEGPGLGRRLTARLYPLAWARGYAQYAGQPITNVVATRHVETATNGALLESQRVAFGRSDPAGRAAMRRATVELGVRDLTAAISAGSAWADSVLPRPNAHSPSTAGMTPRRGTAAPSPSRRFDVDVGRVAGRSLTGLRTESISANRSLAGVTRAAYRVETRLRTTRRQTHREARPEPEPPGAGWALTDTRVTANREVESSVGPTPDAVGDERQFASFARRVTLDHRIRRVWERGNQTERTSGEWTTRYRVGVTVVGEYAPNGTAPDRPTAPTFERGGPLDGPNLVDAPETAVSKLVGGQGGRDAVAAAVATETLDATEGVVYGDRPPELRAWIETELSALRLRLANRSVGVRAGAVATFTANPSARLAADLEEQRAALIDAPESYRGAADRARVGARAALIDETIRRLKRRAARHRRTRRAFDSVLDQIDVASPEALARMRDRRDTPMASPRPRIDGYPPGGPISPLPDGSPAYLTVASVNHSRARGVPPSRPYHSLSAKNVNLFTTPYGDAADAVTSTGGDRSARVRLRTGALALVASASAPNASGRSRRRLARGVSGSLSTLRTRARRVVTDETSLSRPAANAAVAAGFAAWNGSGRRALAATNGSLARAVARSAAERAGASRPPRVERVRTRLEAEFGAILRSPAGTVPQAPVEAVLTHVRDRLTERARTAATERLSPARRNASVRSIPAGLPVGPVPGHWYATVNVWNVEVRGAYARFTLRTRRDAPTPGATTRYVRDGSVVRLDVDGDGTEERLGRDERVAFRTRTVVAVAVPPYRSGVGDVDGNADERAGTWPRPGCTTWDARACPTSV